MPIYEYYCADCNRVFNFMAKSYRQTLEKQPSCPKCGRDQLKRQMSTFAIAGASRKSAAGQADGHADDGAAGPTNGAAEDPRVEREMMRLMEAAEGIDENNPRQLGALMRRMSEISGEQLDPAMEEAMRRLEGGEDPEAIEEDLGELLDGEDGEGGGVGGGPSFDDGLYSL